MTVDIERSELAVALRAWRDRLRASQLELALAAGTTRRHLSFIATLRAGRSMVLAEAGPC